ncbi:type II toxin-antitoxin system HicA family toxin [Achromobacter sp. ACRQX]|uniref:type II toxin-antitoxin system HicA family toxin n=1 Tax=Achromobacter sp. ACRQX TaxID=2918181 RepID=UPI001EF226F5|nr:type II toxin-antitoxin system HicA family toxin [Achromobacter sp. ACRQX]
MKQSEFKRWLASKGVTFAEGSNHTKAYYNGKQTTLPRHPAKELRDGTRQNILKKLGLK